MIELQRKLMGDTVRNDAFARALRAVVKPGDEVIDLGCGTGFLAFLASRLGATHVSCIESGEIVSIARKLATRNGVKNCTFVARHSTAVRTLPKADVLVSETLGNYALEENIIESIEDAKRFLKPGAAILPSRIRQFVCPVTSDRLQREIDVWDAGYDLDFTEARTVSLQNIYVKTLRKDELHEGGGAARLWDTVDFSRENDSVRKGAGEWNAASAVTVHGLALWWEADLAPGITLSTSPLAPATHWEQIYLPLLSSVSLQKGETLAVALESDTRWQTKINLRWTAEHRDTAGKRRSVQTLDMRKGLIG